MEKQNISNLEKYFQVNKELEYLKSSLNNQSNDLIYYYVMETVKLKENIFQQRGSGPNLAGGIITLCTCKHSFRATAFNSNNNNIWVAGITKKSVGENSGNYLFYLARVEKTYDSFYHIWQNLTEEQRNAKCMTNSNFLGDILQPKSNLNDNSNFNDFFKLENYDKPTTGKHSHAQKNDNLLKRDVEYIYRENPEKRPKNVIFDNKKSFVWNKPKIQLNVAHQFSDGKKANINQGVKKEPLREFLDALSD